MFSRSTRGGSLPSWTLRSSLLSFFPLLLFCTFSLICCFSVLSSSRRRWTLPRFTFSFCQDGPTKLSRKGLSLSFRLLSLTLAPSLSVLCSIIRQSPISVGRSSTKCSQSWRRILDKSDVRSNLPNNLGWTGPLTYQPTQRSLFIVSETAFKTVFLINWD